MSTANSDPVIHEYDIRPASYHPYDPRAPIVAEKIIALIHERLPDSHVEHIGSTAIPSCAGKGVIDLMLLYKPGELETVKQAVDELGFQHWAAQRDDADTRPVRLGAIDHDGTRFRIHLHVIAEDAEEVANQRRFRDRLCANPALVEQYMAQKRAILASGVTYGPDYAEAKDAFIKRAREGE